MATRSAFKQKDYLAIAKQRVHRPAQWDHFPRLLVYSRNKKGKTTFCLSAGVDEILIVDPESGTDLMKRRNPFVWAVQQWEDIHDVYGAARSGKLSPNTFKQGESSTPFKWLALDGTTKMNSMALRYVMRLGEEANLDRIPGIVDRRDYGKSGRLMTDMINDFHGLKMGVIFTAQERMVVADSGDSDEDEEATFFIPDLPAAVRGSVNQVVDVIGRLYVVDVTTKNGPAKQRRLQIGPHARYDTGARSDYVIPDMLKNPTVPKLVDLMLNCK
jgi:AAA domain